MNPFIVDDTPIPGVKEVRRRTISDARGSLARLFCADALREHGWTNAVAQVNHTTTKSRGTVRGLHFQMPPYAETKLVTCLRGEVWDVAVDVRPDSATFLRWHAVKLGAGSSCAVLLPEGVAHGYQTLSDDVELLYLHSRPHVPDSERGLNPLDPRVSIPWPEPVLAMSDRDRGFPFVGPAFIGIGR